jgi:hypothetical protein
MKPFEERLSAFQKEIAELSKKHRVCFVPVLGTNAFSIQSQLIYVDMLDRPSMEKFGLLEPEKPASSLLSN